MPIPEHNLVLSDTSEIPAVLAHGTRITENESFVPQSRYSKCLQQTVWSSSACQCQKSKPWDDTWHKCLHKCLSNLLSFTREMRASTSECNTMASNLGVWVFVFTTGEIIQLFIHSFIYLQYQLFPPDQAYSRQSLGNTKCNLNAKPVHHRAPSTHSLTHKGMF